MPSLQPDLFGPGPLPGLTYHPDIVDPQSAAELIARIEAEPLAPFRFQRWTGRRLTASYGWTYDFTDGSLSPGVPIPAWLLPLRECAARSAGLDPATLVQVLLTRYDPGAGIGWHRDRPVFDQVVGISLGSETRLRFRRRRAGGGFDRHALDLQPGSAYRLSGEARHEWEHGIAPVTRTRWSVTFRSMAVRIRNIAAAQ